MNQDILIQFKLVNKPTMKPIIIGVISKNLCIRKKAASMNYKAGTDTDFFHIGSSNPSTISQKNKALENAIFINGELALCLPRTQNIELIKNSLLKLYITDAKDWDLASGIRIPNGFINKLHFPFKAQSVTLSIWPALGYSQESNLVPWTVYSLNTNPPEQHIIEVHANLNYVEFLLLYAAKYQARIDYSIFIYSKPLVLGHATLFYKGNRPGTHSFFFGRLLSCKELVDHKLISINSKA